MMTPSMSMSPSIFGPPPPLASVPNSTSLKSALLWSCGPLPLPKHLRTSLTSAMGTLEESLVMQSEVYFMPWLVAHSSGHFLMTSDSAPNMAWQDMPENLLACLTLSHNSILVVLFEEIADPDLTPRRDVSVCAKLGRPCTCKIESFQFLGGGSTVA